MAAEQEEKQQKSAGAEGEARESGEMNGTGSAAPQGKPKRTPKKLGGKAQQQQQAPEVNDEKAEANGPASEKDQSNGDYGSDNTIQSRNNSRRRQSRGRGRRGGNAVDSSDTESVVRSDVSTSGGRRQRQRARKQQTKSAQGEPLDDITENLDGGGPVGDLMQKGGGPLQGAGKKGAGSALGGLTSGGGDEDEGDEKSEQLRLRLELNLDIEIQLKAKIHGDLTLGLLN